MKKPFINLVLFVLVFVNPVFSQVIPESTKNQHIYDFLDEMALEDYIDINHSVKPYSRFFISTKLAELQKEDSLLNSRQRKDLNYFIREFMINTVCQQGKWNGIWKKPLDKFNPFSIEHQPMHLLNYYDSASFITVNPYMGSQVWANGDDFFYHRWNGLQATASFKKKWGLYLRFWDNFESVELSKENYLTQRQGAFYKSYGNEYSRVEAGFTYKWDWGYTGLFYDNVSWGPAYHGSNIISEKSPAFAQLRLHMEPVSWLSLDYMHGWLRSMIIDSSRSYSFPSTINYSQRDIYRPKYIAANFVTIDPFDKVELSIGNSIIYSDYALQPAFLIPVMFFRAADTYLESKTNTAGNNSQIFASLSVFPWKNLHFYSSLFIDEISFSRMWKPEEHSNYLSWKGGIKAANIVNSNLSAVVEYTRTNPEVYRHIIPATNFETNNFTLGHYLKDNAREIYANVKYKPLSRLIIRLEYTNIKKGPDYHKVNVSSRHGLPFMDYVVFENQIINFDVSFRIKNNITIWSGYRYMQPSGDLRFIPAVYDNKKGTFTIGLSWN